MSVWFTLYEAEYGIGYEFYISIIHALYFVYICSLNVYDSLGALEGRLAGYVARNALLVDRDQKNSKQPKANQNNMKKLYLTICAASMAVALNVGAFSVDVAQSQLGVYALGGGGEFNVVPTGKPALLNNYAPAAIVNGGFQSFCMEYTEGLPAKTYDAAISDRAFNGGVGPAGDPISQGTCYLYDMFARGVLAGYNYTPGAGRAQNAWELQQAIWYLEDESPNSNAGATFLALVVTKFGSLANAKLDAAGENFFGVQVLNLTYTDERGAVQMAQDQIVKVPDAGSAMLLLGMGLAGLGLYSRRSRE